MKQTDCRFINKYGTDCVALNRLYCDKDDKPCAFYKPKEKEAITDGKSGVKGGK